MVCKILELRGYQVDDIDRYMWEEDFVRHFGETPDRQQLNFVVCKKEDTTYKLVVLFAEGPPTAKTIRLYGEYMRKYGYRWAIVLLTRCEPTRQAVKAVSTLMPRAFVEFMRTEEVSDWIQDRPGVDYGPRWLGDGGVRAEQQREREKIVEMLQETVVVDPDLEKLMPRYPDEAAKKPRRRRKK